MNAPPKSLCLSAVCFAIGLLMFAVWVGASPERRPWAIQSCSDLECVVVFLNKLPEQDAVEAKVVVINSQRSFLGVLSDPYRIYYRRVR